MIHECKPREIKIEKIRKFVQHILNYSTKKKMITWEVWLSLSMIIYDLQKDFEINPFNLPEEIKDYLALLTADVEGFE